MHALHFDSDGADPFARERLMVTQSATLLKRCYFFERKIIRLCAGWIPAVRHWESKLLLPEVIWESSVLAREWRRRILELRFPERRIVADDEVRWVEFLGRLGDAPTATAFVLGLADGVKPWMLSVYGRLQAQADALDDAPTQYWLRHGIVDLERQIVRLREVAVASLQQFPEDAVAARHWSAHWSAVLSGVSADIVLAPVLAPPPVVPRGGGGELPFVVARRAARDPRFERRAFAWPDRHTPGFAGDGRQLQARQAVHHVNEVWAAEMAAACLHDLMPVAPAEFVDDAARWCFDEIRHCRMGYARLHEWGFTDGEIPLDSFSYDAGEDGDALMRLGIIFYFESTYIHTKKERMVLFGEMGDRLSSHDMDFDWADELIHAHYGKRWLETLLKTSGDARDLAAIKNQARQVVAARVARATDADKAESRATFERVVDKIPLHAS